MPTKSSDAAKEPSAEKPSRQELLEKLRRTRREKRNGGGPSATVSPATEAQQRAESAVMNLAADNPEILKAAMGLLSKDRNELLKGLRGRSGDPAPSSLDTAASSLAKNGDPNGGDSDSDEEPPLASGR